MQGRQGGSVHPDDAVRRSADATGPALHISIAFAACALLAVVPTPVRAEEPIAAKRQFGLVLKAAPLPPRAIGFYARGCLAGGKALPIDGPAWQVMRLSRNRNWGHPRLVAFIERFARDAKREGWPGLLIGDMAQPRGGPMLTGHRSHQIGLDVDIWYRPAPPRRLSRAERERLSSIALAGYRATRVTRNWSPAYLRLLRRAASYPEVERVFVHPAVKRALCDAAGADRAWLRRVRPIWGHNYHFHVRLACPPGERGCTPQKPPPPGDGCGAQLTYWLKLVSRPPKPPRRARPKRKRKPRVRTLAWLPPACRRVLAVDSPPLYADPGGPTGPVPLPVLRPPKRVTARALQDRP